MDVMEFFGTVPVMNVAPTLGADRVVLGLVEMGDRRMGPRGGGIPKQRNEAGFADIGFPGEAAKLDERSVQIESSAAPCHRHASR
jgi:hypothetical protein